MLTQARRNKRVAQKPMPTLLKKQGMTRHEWVRSKCTAYTAALCVLNPHRTGHIQYKRANNRAESSHVPVRSLGPKQ